jgi:acetolactate synthase-1/2/3 large subunit
MYGDGCFLFPTNLVRIDVDQDQLSRHPATVSLQADSAVALAALGEKIEAEGKGTGRDSGAQRAYVARQKALAELDPTMRGQVTFIEAMRDALPGAIIVGDSTQPIYAANLCYDHDRPGGWFNAATGFGALGFGPPAAIGAALAAPGAPVVCLTGDGGFQFTLAELGAATDAGTPVIFVVWNNRGYREIETSMRAVGVEPVGVSPAPPDFCKLAEAYGIGAERLSSVEGLGPALKKARSMDEPYLIEIVVD